MSQLIVIIGATASGKTNLGIRLAKHFGTDIISSDSRQFYKEMSIGTAKPTEDELNTAKHHFINHLSIHNDYSVGNYEKDAIALIENLFQTKDKLILLGGSGLFINAVLYGLDDFPRVSQIVKDKYISLLNQNGIAFLQEELKEKDPKYYEEVDVQNPHRLIRALSVIEVGGKPFSNYRNQSPKKRNFEPIIIYLDWEREFLYYRINRRVDMMMEEGLLEEALQLYPFRHLNALQTVGYQELFDYFDKKSTLDEAIGLIKRNSRRYAKRQMTWFRKIDNKHSFKPDKVDEIIQLIEMSSDN